MDVLTIILLLLVVGVVLYISSDDVSNWFNSFYGWMCSCSKSGAEDREGSEMDNAEGFGAGGGALQSLYSNDGPQDVYLTVNNDTGRGSWGGYWGGYGWGYDPYRYWRGVPWYLPSRGLNRAVYYPYLYDYSVDRYGRYYPYW